VRNTWTRAWLATFIVLVGASAVARSRHDWLIQAEEPVMDWLLDGTDTSGWARVDFFGDPWLVYPGVVVLAVIAFWFSRAVAATILLTMLFGVVTALVTKNIVGRPRPEVLDGVTSSSFPSLFVVQAGIFWGLVTLMVWWFRTPRLLWQIVLELTIVAVLLTAMGRIIGGHHWPSDAVGSAIVVALALISAAIVLEDHPPRRRRRSETSSDDDLLAVG
jgi:undecaprenyl-diphosphatase